MSSGITPRCVDWGQRRVIAIDMAERLRFLRKRAGLSQGEVANLIGVTQQALSNWERGFRPPNRENLLRLAKVYNTTVDWIIGGTKEVGDGTDTLTAAAHANPPPEGVDIEEWEQRARARLEELLQEIREDWERTKRQRGG